MAYRLVSENATINELVLTPTTNKTVGEPEVNNGLLGFYSAGAKANEPATFVFKAKRIECDCDATLAYNAGDAVYDAGIPTGTVNKTSSAGRRLVGYVLRTYPANTSKILVESFDGTRAPV